MSDLHLGAHHDAAVQSLIADVAAVRPDLTVVTGDWTMRARPVEFDLAKELLKRLPEPVLSVLGNHDLPLAGPQRLLRPYDRYRTWICDDLDPVIHLAGLTAAGVASMPRWRWKDGRVTRQQTTSLTAAFAAAPPDGLRLIALHHPPTGRRLVGRSRLLTAAREAGVHLVLAGHTHIPEVRRLAGGPVLITAGTSTSRRTRGTPRSWSRITVAGGTVTVVERYPSGAGWHTGRLTTVPGSPVASGG
ncbi:MULTISPECIES: metallophosphoesterase [unclassified Actinoplanes]|uniref:metallophosphoesterase family protein n=1 Tax=unclassified Actinoplanes TaxID=2626549 RepID=UPI001E2E7640|nr:MULTISPECIES: metallophosphoesterase [unclassified Actinoplanes]